MNQIEKYKYSHIMIISNRPQDWIGLKREILKKIKLNGFKDDNLEISASEKGIAIKSNSQRINKYWESTLRLINDNLKDMYYGRVYATIIKKKI